MKWVRARLRAFGPLRLLDDCAALMILECGAAAEDELRRTMISARPPPMQRIALGLVLRAVRHQRVEAMNDPRPATLVPLAANPSPKEALRRIA